jgi:hypothetical protein
MSRYPAAISAPINARILPKIDLPDIAAESKLHEMEIKDRAQVSFRATKIPPTNASPIPRRTARLTFSW